jgi:glycosyltransferase involved in cell wall biosynthesis
MKLEVIICAHNPRRDFVERTLAALRSQSLAVDEWKLLLIDNASSEPLENTVDLSWHPHARIIREEALGLTHARLRAVLETQAEILIFSDDDTVFDPNYLAFAKTKFETSPKLGVAGGPSMAEYETPPAEWFSPILAPLGCRDLGPDELMANWENVAQKTYPASAPIGAGMAIRYEILKTWAKLVDSDLMRQDLGRKGTALSSGEDNDINMVALANGWDIGYFPQLRLTHLISARRIEAEYLKQLAFASSRDWVRALALHHICPWPPIPGWTVPFRKMKAWFSYRAWAGSAERIRWAGACGHFVGRATIQRD